MAGHGLEGLLARLTALLCRKKELLQDIRQVTLEQSGFLEPEKTGELAALLKTRQELIDAVNSLDTGVAELEKSILVSAGISSFQQAMEFFNDDWDKVECLQREIRAQLALIIKQDADNVQKLREAQSGLKKKIMSLQEGKEMLRLYRGMEASGDYVDRQK